MTCDPTLFSGKNSPNTTQSNRVFLGKRRVDRALILTYLNSAMAEVFPHYCLSFSISAIFKGKRVVKVGSKVQTLGPSLFYENSNPAKNVQTMFLFAIVIPLVRITAILDHIWGSKGPETSIKGYFVDAESSHKTLKT